MMNPPNPRKNRGCQVSFKKVLAIPACFGFFSARTATNDPFVYRLGLQIFILARRVRLPYGSPFFKFQPPPKAGAF